MGAPSSSGSTSPGWSGIAALGAGESPQRNPHGKTATAERVVAKVVARAAREVTVVEYGVAIGEMAHAVRRNVIVTVEQTTGRQVVEVNVHVVVLDQLSTSEDGSDARPLAAARVR